MQNQFDFGKIIITLILIFLIACKSDSSSKKEKTNPDSFTIETSKIKKLLNDDNLPDITVDSIHFKKDTLEAFITDDYHTIIHDVMIDQIVSFIFADFSRISTSSISGVKIYYRTPKRKTNKDEYFLLHKVALKDLKSNLRMYSYAKFRRIIDGILQEHKKNPEDDIFETLNFYTNAILSEDKKIEFQFFGFDFRIFLINLLVECETNNEKYYREATKRIFERIEENNLEGKELFENIEKLFVEGCNNTSEPELPTIKI